MTSDPVRERLRVLLRENDLTMARASTAIGRNKTYLQQYLVRGMPKVLGFQDSEALAKLLQCDPAELRHSELPPRKPQTRTRRYPPRGLPGAPLVAVPEMEVEAAAGGGAVADEITEERARWYLPEAMVRHEGDANPETLRILRVRGDSMEPEMREGDRLLVDTARRRPTTGELFVLFDGTGLVVKRVEMVPGEAHLRLLSANPAYAPYAALGEEVHIVGKVVWVLRRM